MKIITQKYLSPEQKEVAMGIWNTEYPINLQMPGMEDFDEFLEPLVDPKYYLLLNDEDKMAGWAATFAAGPTRSFFIMSDGGYHGKGYGTILLNELKKEGPQLFAWAVDHDSYVKPDGRPYPSPIPFYLKNGFIVNNELRLENEVLSAVNILWKADDTSA